MNQTTTCKCGKPTMDGHPVCRMCWQAHRAEVLKPDPKNDAVNDGDKETGKMFR